MKTVRTIARIICSLTTILLLSPALAEKAQSISPGVYKKLAAAEDLIAKNSYQAAAASLKKLVADMDDPDYEKAVVLRSLASVHALQEHYAEATNALEQALDMDAFNEEQKQPVMRNLGQLYMAQEKYQKAVDVLEAWIRDAKAPSGEDYISLASAHARLKNFRRGIPYARKAISLAKKPKEPWYQLLLALCYEAKDMQAGAYTLKDLIRLFPPNKKYWQQLASIYHEMKRPDKALAVRKMAYDKGLLVTEKDIVDLAQLLLHQEAPYKAGEILSRELTTGRLTNRSKHWELLADTWTQAHEFERATAAIKKASVLSDKGDLYYRLGRIYIEQEKWQDAHRALAKALNKGKLKDPGNTHLLFGMSCYELQFKEKARDAFAQARKFKNTRQAANQWLDYLSEESAG